MNNSLPFPFSFRLAAILLSVALLFLFIYLGQGIFIPLILGLMFAILLRPLVAALQHKLRFPIVLAASVSVILTILLVTGIVYFISQQIGEIAGDWDKIEANLVDNYRHLQLWVQRKYGFSFVEQNKYIEKVSSDATSQGKELIGSTLNSFSGTVLNFILIPIYTFLLLLHRNLFIVFFLRLFENEPQRRIHQILLQVKASVQSFLAGTLIEMGIVSTLSAISLMVIGMKYAILLGAVTGMLNLIPYIGILVATLLTLLATLTDSSGVSAIAAVLVVNFSIHLLDANVLMPMVVSRKVKINAFIAILLIVTGSHLAGVAGMFLAIPLAAILKIIFDEIEPLQPWGYLMGDNIPYTAEWQKEDIPVADEASLQEIKNQQRLIALKNRLNGIYKLFTGK